MNLVARALPRPSEPLRIVKQIRFVHNEEETTFYVKDGKAFYFEFHFDKIVVNQRNKKQKKPVSIKPFVQDIACSVPNDKFVRVGDAVPHEIGRKIAAYSLGDRERDVRPPRGRCACVFPPPSLLRRHRRNHRGGHTYRPVLRQPTQGICDVLPLQRYAFQTGHRNLGFHRMVSWASRRQK